MPLVLADRVRDTTTTTGTGTVTLSGTAPTGYQNFSVIGNGNTTYYTINAGSQWEVGIGTYSSTGPTLARNTVLESSNGNALVDFAAGTKDVFVTYPSDEAVYQDGATIAAGTAVLGVANGGTGVTTSTGTSSVVLSNSPTLVTPTLGAASATSIANALGAVGTPSYTFTGDLNTGMWSPAGDTLAFSTNGTERVRIRSNGLFGINVDPAAQLHARAAASDSMALIAQFDVLGITNPADSHGLRISADTVTNLVQLASTGSNNGGFTFLTGTNERMRITSAGNVGIGTDAPGARVDVVGVSDSLPMRVLRQGTYGEIIRIGRNGVSETASINYPTDGVFAINTASTERMRITASGFIGVGTSAPANEFEVYGVNSPRLAIRAPESISETPELGFQYGFAANSSNNTLALLRAIPTQVDPSPLRADLAFFTNRGDNNEECMRITAAGDVGVGTATPDIFGRFYTRSVGINSSGTTMLQINGTTYGGIDLGFNGTRTANILAETAGFYLQTVTAAPMVFATNGVERARITSAGNVGIGTTAPAAQFVVSNANAAGIEVSPTGGVGGGATVATYNRSTAAYTSLTTYSSTMTWYANGSTRAMDLDTSGNLGIGTNSPSTKLDVVGAGIRAVTTTTTSAGSPLGSQIYLGDANFASSFALRGPGIGAVFDAGQAVAASLAFYTYSSATRNERMRLDPNGNLGIGTTSPDARLDILGTSSDQLRLRTAETEEYRIGRNASTGLLDFYGSQTGFTGYTFGGIDGERMRIDSSGRVGIGTSAPNANLQIVSASTTVARLTTTGAATQAELSFGSVGGSGTVSLDQSGNWVARTQQASMFIDNFGAGGSINFRTGGANTRFSISNTGAITSSDLADAVGYKGLPPNVQGSGYTLVMADQGKMVTITGGVTIPANGSVAFPVGTTVVIYNNSASNQTISITTDTLRLAGTATTGARTLAQRGFATCIKVAATEWVVTGNVT